MQCNHPFCGYPIFKQTDYVPWFPQPTCMASPPIMPVPTACPEVVGEGDVTSMMYPDGSQQYFFLPKNFGTGPYFYKNNSIWLIRSICLPNYNQPNNFDTPMCTQPACCYPSNEKPITGFQLQFHSDAGTSTTDLHYFFPCLRTCEWVPRLVASVQAELPTESPAMNNYQGPCSKPCNCNNVNEPTPCKSAMSVDNASETKDKEKEKQKKKPEIKIECQCKEYEERNAKKKNAANKRTKFSDEKNVKIKSENDKTDSTVKEAPTCKCHGEESNAPEYKCEVAEQRSAAPYTKCPAEPATNRCKCKTAMESDKSNHKCLCRTSSVCAACRSIKFLNLRRSKCKKSCSSSAMDKYCKCDCHVDADKKDDKEDTSNTREENCAAIRSDEKMSDVSGNSSDNTVTDTACSSRTSLCDACSSLCEWYNYLFSKIPPSNDNTTNCDHLR